MTRTKGVFGKVLAEMEETVSQVLEVLQVLDRLTYVCWTYLKALRYVSEKIRG